MSGHSDSGICPECGNKTDRYTDYKPIDFIYETCPNCGWYNRTETGKMTAEELKEYQEERKEWAD